MAERRMFAKTIIDSDAFIDMPLSAQALYLHLSMRADDDGFVNNPKRIQRMIGAADDDMKLLVAKSFLIPFENGIVVIKHWKVHNYIRSDRKKQTVYSDEMALLEVRENGAYELIGALAIEEDSSETPRQKAYRESSLPYSFEYKIRRVFTGRLCPICGAVMQKEVENGIETKNRIPTIQHNIPISKGGRHELGNISVICKECNITLRDTETGDLNAEEVIEEWEKICSVSQASVKCQSNDSQMSAQDRLGKDRLGKDRLVESIAADDTPSAPAPTKTKHKYGEYNNVRLTDDEMNKLNEELGAHMTTACITFLDEYIEMKGYKAKSHYLAIKKWVVSAVKERQPKEQDRLAWLDEIDWSGADDN